MLMLDGLNRGQWGRDSGARRQGGPSTARRARLIHPRSDTRGAGRRKRPAVCQRRSGAGAPRVYPGLLSGPAIRAAGPRVGQPCCRRARCREAADGYLPRAGFCLFGVISDALTCLRLVAVVVRSGGGGGAPGGRRRRGGGTCPAGRASTCACRGGEGIRERKGGDGAGGGQDCEHCARRTLRAAHVRALYAASAITWPRRASGCSTRRARARADVPARVPPSVARASAVRGYVLYRLRAVYAPYTRSIRAVSPPSPPSPRRPHLA